MVSYILAYINQDIKREWYFRLAIGSECISTESKLLHMVTCLTDTLRWMMVENFNDVLHNHSENDLNIWLERISVWSMPRFIVQYLVVLYVDYIYWYDVSVGETTWIISTRLPINLSSVFFVDHLSIFNGHVREQYFIILPGCICTQLLVSLRW